MASKKPSSNSTVRTPVEKLKGKQKIEHYKIAAYKTLYQFAETLGLYEASDLFQTTLKEDKATDEKLSEIAEDTITIRAYNNKFNLLHHE